MPLALVSSVVCLFTLFECILRFSLVSSVGAKSKSDGYRSIRTSLKLQGDSQVQELNQRCKDMQLQLSELGLNTSVNYTRNE